MSMQDYFKNKRVTVMGLGLLGRGVGDAAYIAEMGAAEVIVTDLKTEEELAVSVAQMRQYENVRFVFGEHRLEDFVDRDLVLVAAGVPLDSPYLQHAREAGVLLRQSAALFAELSGVPIIGVTGTRGKSTVAHLVHHVLSTVTGESILLGGNIRGVSNLQLLKEVQTDSLCVMELDSWQLQGFGWAQLSPQIAVFTNFMPDHLNYYMRSAQSEEAALEQYFADKANIFLYQEESGVLVTTPAVFEAARSFAAGRDITLGQEVILVDDSTLPEELSIAMPGAHNRLNAALAYEALKAVSLTDEEILPVLATFTGVEGRLQKVGEVSGVPIYNDNNATTPAATAAGLQAVAAGHNVVVLAGGTDKGLAVDSLATAITEYCAHVVLYSGTGTEKLKAALSADVSYEEHEYFADAVRAAVATAAPGNVILFSPGFASFNAEFKNEYERNDAFVSLLKSIVSQDD